MYKIPNSVYSYKELAFNCFAYNSLRMFYVVLMGIWFFQLTNYKQIVLHLLQTDNVIILGTASSLKCEYSAVG